MSSIQERDHQYIAGTYARFPVTIVSGKGSIAVDENGREYIDMGTGIGVDAFGYGDEQWLSAVEAQLHKVQHTSNLYYTEPAVELAHLLCEKTGMSKVFFVNSGAEANEGCMKLAIKYFYARCLVKNSGIRYWISWYILVCSWRSLLAVDRL